MNEQLLSAALELTSRLDLPAVLQQFVDTAAGISGARYAALAVLDHRGETVLFVHHGVDEETQRILGHPPRGTGVLAEIPTHGALVLPEISAHPRFGGWPAGHPPMHTFLGLPLRINEQVFGRLYLADKDGGFTPEDVTSVDLLAKAAGVAIEFAQPADAGAAGQVATILETWVQVRARRRRAQAVAGLVLSAGAVAAAFMLVALMR